MSKGVSLEFTGEKEKELIKHTKKLYKSAQASLLTSYWWIGQNVFSFYEKKKKYGDETLKKIAKKVGMKRDTLSKVCQFARQYTEDQVTELTTGKFPVSWNTIYHNLTIKTKDFMTAYSKSNTRKELVTAITRLKPHHEEKESTNQPATEISAIKSRTTKLKKSDNKGFDGKYEHRSTKKGFLLALNFKEDKVESINAKSLKTALADIIRQLGKNYVVSVEPA